LQDKHVDGIILGPIEANADYIRELAKRTPVVQVDRQLDGPGIAAVVVDNEDGAYRATRLLTDKGHTRIAVIRWQKRIVTLTQRFAGYERALCEAGIPVDPGLVVDVPSLAATEAGIVAQQLLRREPRPTAIFALNNQIGLGVLGAVQQLGLHIPADIALIVFDDLDCFALITPSITAICQPAFAIGEAAMKLLARQIELAGDFAPEVVILPTQLIVRESI
jgi:LacI family transcriptional regulator